MMARLDVTTDGWRTFHPLVLSSEIASLETAVKAIKAAGTSDTLDAMLSCECGAYEFGGCEQCEPEDLTHA